jgi:hypothetical protein
VTRRKPIRFAGLGKRSTFKLSRPKFRLGGRSLSRIGAHPASRVGARLARILVRSQILTVFLGLCVLGFIVGAQTRPASGAFPYAELFDQLEVVSFRDSPSDTSSRFVVQLCAGGKAFSQYDIESRTFQPPPSGRSYARTITGTHYGPLRVRGHVGYGFWLEVPSRRAMLPEQYSELYRRTLDFVKPVSNLTGVLGILSGYSVGYRLGTWNGSLSSRQVQKRVLAAPDLGRTIAREAWRRVLLEPVVMTGEEDASRFAAITGTHQLYANFFRLALSDSDGFIPNEAARLEQLGHLQEARAMRAFTAAVRRAAVDSVHMTNDDFEAVERWATLLDRRGHWIQGATPPPGEERIKLMGTLAWYGLAPPAPNVERVWVGPRMLVRAGDAEGFVADEIPATGAGCPISWRPHLREENGGASAMVSAWLADRPEFTALAVLGNRIAHGIGEARKQLAEASARARAARAEKPAPANPPVDAVVASRAPSIVPAGERDAGAYEFAIPSMAGASIKLVVSDSSQARALALAAEAVMQRPDVPASNPGDATTKSGGIDTAARAQPVVAAGTSLGSTLDAAADTLRAHGVRGALIEVPGTTLALGASAGGEPWSIVIRDPRGRMPAIARLRLSNGQAVATSAGREPSQGLIGVAVVAADAATASRWSAALAAQDPRQALAQARQHEEIAAVLIQGGADGHEIIWVEAELRNCLVLDSQATSLFRFEPF